MTGGSPFEHYPLRPGFWDEMISDGSVRPEYRHTFDTLRQLSAEDLHQKDKLAAELFMSQGITFTVYSEDKGIERIFPFDILPRIIRGSEWDLIETGIRQRLQALNLFL
ncbi:MAG: circularly permuted type 2 ATP-grasp protein, partial [Chitinophagaceae bacterium]